MNPAPTSPGAWEAFRQAIRADLGPPLRSLEAPLDRWLSSLPMGVAQAAVISLFLVVGCWVWTLRRSYVYLGAPSQARWRDLRIWATLLLLPYVAVYYLLGR